jgi:hypothetical protein
VRWPKLEPGSLILVLWHDAETRQGWLSEDDPPEQSAQALSVGWLLDPARKTQMGAELILCADRGEGAVYPNNRRIAIPRGMIRELRSVDGTVLWSRVAVRAAGRRQDRLSAPSAD